jgi:hypothetical protein
LSFPNTALLGSSPLLEPLEPGAAAGDRSLCGVAPLHRWYEQAHGVRLPPELDLLITPFRRRGRDGSVLPPDLELLDRATVDFLEDPGGDDGPGVESP